MSTTGVESFGRSVVRVTPSEESKIGHDTRVDYIDIGIFQCISYVCSETQEDYLYRKFPVYPGPIPMRKRCIGHQGSCGAILAPSPAEIYYLVPIPLYK